MHQKHWWYWLLGTSCNCWGLVLVCVWKKVLLNSPNVFWLTLLSTYRFPFPLHHVSIRYLQRMGSFIFFRFIYYSVANLLLLVECRDFWICKKCRKQMDVNGHLFHPSNACGRTCNAWLQLGVPFRIKSDNSAKHWIPVECSLTARMTHVGVILMVLDGWCLTQLLHTLFYYLWSWLTPI